MRLIDADELRNRIIAFCTGCSTTYLTVENIVMMINQADTVDAVPVVRCGECIFYDQENSSNWCSHPKGLCNPGESDFCGYGKAHTNSIPLNQEERWLKTI